MSLVQDIKCIVGLHQWRTWRTNLSLSRKSRHCVFKRTCANCLKVEEKRGEPHDWGEWKDRTRVSCKQQRVCSRCGLKESRSSPNHSPGLWRYVAPDSCSQKRVCRRCGASLGRRVQHKWESKPRPGDGGGQERVCGRCGEVEFARPSRPDFKRYTGSGVCDVCNAPITPDGAHLVPVDVFYTSEKYKKWLPESPMFVMIMMLGGPEAYLKKMRAKDTTSHSAVCSKCIHLFE